MEYNPMYDNTDQSGFEPLYGPAGTKAPNVNTPFKDELLGIKASPAFAEKISDEEMYATNPELDPANIDDYKPAGEQSINEIKAMRQAHAEKLKLDAEAFAKSPAGQLEMAKSMLSKEELEYVQRLAADTRNHSSATDTLVALGKSFSEPQKPSVGPLGASRSDDRAKGIEGVSPNTFYGLVDSAQLGVDKVVGGVSSLLYKASGGAIGKSAAELEKQYAQSERIIAQEMKDASGLTKFLGKGLEIGMNAAAIGIPLAATGAVSAPATAATKVGRTLQRLMTGSKLGFLAGALEPSDDWTESAKYMGIGAATGAVLNAALEPAAQYAGKAIGKAISSQSAAKAGTVKEAFSNTLEQLSAAEKVVDDTLPGLQPGYRKQITEKFQSLAKGLYTKAATDEVPVQKVQELFTRSPVLAKTADQLLKQMGSDDIPLNSVGFLHSVKENVAGMLKSSETPDLLRSAIGDLKGLLESSSTSYAEANSVYATMKNLPKFINGNFKMPKELSDNIGYAISKNAQSFRKYLGEDAFNQYIKGTINGALKGLKGNAETSGILNLVNTDSKMEVWSALLKDTNPKLLVKLQGLNHLQSVYPQMKMSGFLSKVPVIGDMLKDLTEGKINPVAIRWLEEKSSDAAALSKLMKQGATSDAIASATAKALTIQASRMNVERNKK